MKFFLLLALLFTGAANAVQITTNQIYRYNNKFSSSLPSETLLGDMLLNADRLRYADKTLTAAQIKALNTTPITIIAAPGATKAIVVDSVHAVNTFLTAAFEAGSQTLDIAYTNAAGAKPVTFTNAWLETASTALASVQASTTQIAPVANAAIVVSTASTDPTTGAGSISLRVYYHEVPVAAF